jgi:hypothetical protein
VPSSRFTPTTLKTLVSSPTDYASSGSGSEHRTVTYAELATGQTQLKSSRACHRHVTAELRLRLAYCQHTALELPCILPLLLPIPSTSSPWVDTLILALNPSAPFPHPHSHAPFPHPHSHAPLPHSHSPSPLPFPIPMLPFPMLP